MAATMQQPQMGLTFEQVWAALMELKARQEELAAYQRETSEEMRKTDEEMRKTDEQVRETSEQMRKTDEQMRETSEQMRKTDEQMRETDERMRETDERMRKTDERIDKMAAKVDRVSENLGGVNRSLGELIETLIAAKLWEKFDAYPYNLRRAYQRIPLYDEGSKVLTDIDILLSNGEYAMAVEVKRELDSKKDVDHHLKRMELIKKYPPAECVGKKLLGAMAGGTVDPDVQSYAHSVGLFVLELTGESVRLADTPVGFNVRQW
ncbi:hypothetical protein AGMMS4952_06080 [Spirochaetia bacterium]|nr:hypothetical protein AGMMS4952_06080 [Spirochaetia bacterium]